MRLDKLLDGLDYTIIKGEESVCVYSVTHNAIEISSGDCYIMLHTDSRGSANADIAIKNGATVLITDKYIRFCADITVVVVENIRRAYAVISGNYYNNAHKKLRLVGVVGTNGKSTTAYLIWKIMSRLGKKSGFIGTGQYMIGGEWYPSDSTTPDPMLLHNIFDKMARAGVDVVAMEVSAHSIYLEKIYGLKFDIGIFNNLSHDHLDYFDSIERLSAVKQSYFLDGYPRIAIVNSDDVVGKRLADISLLPLFTYGLGDGVDISACNVGWGDGMTRYTMSIEGRRYDITSKLFGKFNVYNELSAILTVKLLGEHMEEIINALKDIPPMSGRANIKEVDGVRYVIDYAHTPIGVASVLKEVREVTAGRVICLLGAGGDRDKSKRKEMGNLAGRYADILVLTSDNPRNERPIDIISDIYSGVNKTKDIYIEEDRKKAVAIAVKIAQEGDSVLLVGKGAEEYIEKNGKKYLYSDKSAIEEILGIEWI